MRAHVHNDDSPYNMCCMGMCMKVLVFAPHADDELLGVGGTIAKHVAQQDTVLVCIVTQPTEPVFDRDLYKVIQAEAAEAHRILGIQETHFLQYPSTMLEQVPRYELNEKIGKLINTIKPDIVYLPHAGDMQKDHAIVADAVMVAVRPKIEKISGIYAYETLSETEWNSPHIQHAFLPTVYVDITAYIHVKLQAMQCFRSQLAAFPHPRSLEAIEALAKFRGSTILAEAAEAFVLIRGIR